MLFQGCTPESETEFCRCWTSIASGCAGWWGSSPVYSFAFDAPPVVREMGDGVKPVTFELRGTALPSANKIQQLS